MSRALKSTCTSLKSWIRPAAQRRHATQINLQFQVHVLDIRRAPADPADMSIGRSFRQIFFNATQGTDQVSSSVFHADVLTQHSKKNNWRQQKKRNNRTTETEARKTKNQQTLRQTLKIMKCKTKNPPKKNVQFRVKTRTPHLKKKKLHYPPLESSSLIATMFPFSSQS